jgi:hypothetical protein
LTGRYLSWTSHKQQLDTESPEGVLLKRKHRNPQQVVRENDDSIAVSLEKAAPLHPVAVAHTVVPPEPGYYSIFVDSPDSLPEPFGGYLHEKRTNLLYIGIASVSLYVRLIEQDLRHKQPSSFFRGIGAILGFRPSPGSLAGKRNQNNYRFSPDDTCAIIAWNQEHLSVRFVAIDTNAFPSAERNAIGRNCPILNTTHNTDCLQALADLRLECRSVARRPTA